MWKGSGEVNEPRFSFAVVGDRTGSSMPGVFETALREINLLRPDFAICVGYPFRWFQGDSFDVFVFTGGAEGTSRRDCRHFGANALGTPYDALNWSFAWNGAWQEIL